MITRRLCLALALLSSLTSAAEVPSVVLTLADGTSVHLRDFRFVVEIGSWSKGESPSTARVDRFPTAELLSAKKTVPLAGSTLEFARTT